MPWGVAAAAVGGGLSLMGSSKSANAAKDAAKAARPRPFNLSTMYGNVNFTPGGLTTEGGVGSQYAQSFADLIGNRLGFAQGMGVGTLGERPFDLGAAIGDPMNPAGRAGQQFADLGALFGGQAGQALGAASNFDIDAFAGQQFDRLNRLAAPAESTAANTLASRLFAGGRLGANDTRSGRAFGELNLSQSLARDNRLGQALGLATSESDRLYGLASGLGTQGANFASSGANLATNLQQRISQMFGSIRGDQEATATFQNNLFGQLLSQAGAGQTGLQNIFSPLQQAVQQAMSGGNIQNVAGANSANAIMASGQQQANLYGGLGAGLMNAGVGYLQNNGFSNPFAGLLGGNELSKAGASGPAGGAKGGDMIYYGPSNIGIGAGENQRSGWWGA